MYWFVSGRVKIMILRLVRIELLTLRLWDLRAHDCPHGRGDEEVTTSFLKKKMLVYISSVSHNFR